MGKEDFMIDLGKRPDELFIITNFSWISSLPAESPYGNLVLKGFKLIGRLDEANRRLSESYHFWDKARSMNIELVASEQPYQRHVFANEQAVYLMRRAADEMIALVWCLDQYEQKGKFPDKIEIDAIGPLLKKLKKQDGWSAGRLFEEQKDMLGTLNEISNAFKHSFIHSDITLLGFSEPQIFTLGLDHNKLKSGSEISRVSLAKLIQDFSQFYRTVVSWLKAYGVRNSNNEQGKGREFTHVDRITDYQ